MDLTCSVSDMTSIFPTSKNLRVWLQRLQKRSDPPPFSCRQCTFLIIIHLEELVRFKVTLDFLQENCLGFPKTDDGEKTWKNVTKEVRKKLRRLWEGDVAPNPYLVERYGGPYPDEPLAESADVDFFKLYSND